LVAGGERPVAAPNHYQRLRLPTAATAQDLRQAFRSLSKLYHPDTTTLPPAEAEEQFRQLLQAYLTLSDPGLRQAYDNQLRQEQLLRVAALSRSLSAPKGPLALQRPQSVRRALSGGEWFALLLLAVSLAFSLVLGIGLAWWRGGELMAQPLGLLQPVAGQTVAATGAGAGDDQPASAPHPALQPSAPRT
jgi:hypothetical protein